MILIYLSLDSHKKKSKHKTIAIIKKQKHLHQLCQSINQHNINFHIHMEVSSERPRLVVDVHVKAIQNKTFSKTSKIDLFLLTVFCVIQFSLQFAPDQQG